MLHNRTGSAGSAKTAAAAGEERLSMNCTIRQAGPADEKKIRELYLEMLRTIYHTEAAEGYEDGYLDKFWAGNEDRVYVAEDRGVE